MIKGGAKVIEIVRPCLVTTFVFQKPVLKRKKYKQIYYVVKVRNTFGKLIKGEKKFWENRKHKLVWIDT